MYRVLLLAVLLGGCASMMGTQAPSAAQPPFEAITFEIKSWGRPIDSWAVRADGSAEHVKMVDEDPSTFPEYTLEHRVFTVLPADYAKLSAMAAALPEPRLSRDDCDERATDLPYGTLRLTRGEQEEAIAFDVGCLDARYQAFVGQLRAMDAAVTEWAAKTAAVKSEPIAE